MTLPAACHFSEASGHWSISTGKERDTETGNDDFGARYYSNRFGRWLSADWSDIPAPVPYANLSNPQTLNLYAMVNDNPETFADLDGHCGGPNDPCAGISVTAEVTQQPTMQVNQKVPGTNTQVTGPVGEITFTVTKDGKPLPGVKATETNTVTQTVNGMKQDPGPPFEGKTSSDKNGQFKDAVGLVLETNGSDKQAKVVTSFFNGNAIEQTDKQAVTLILPQNGVACLATDTRTVGNVNANGTQSPTYKITPDKPTVTVTPLPKKPNP